MALALVNDPDIVFLDEPTTGLDPQARRQLWDVVQGLQKQGKTILLTTHYMEEAEKLCDRVAIVDHGHIIESGSPSDLIHRYFADIAIEFRDPNHADPASFPQHARGQPRDELRMDRVTVYSADVPKTMAALLERETGSADGSGGSLRDLSVRSATLEDVFLKLTGRALRD